MLLTLAVALLGFSSLLADDPKVTLKPGDPAPPLKATKWFNGKEVNAFEPGKVYVIEFWATWCGPCVAEMPYVQQLADRLRDESRILVLGVSVDESPGLVKPFVDRLGCRYPVLLADAAVWTTWRFSAIPKNLIVGPGGEIVASDVPFDRDGKRWLESMATRLRAAAESISSPPR